MSTLTHFLLSLSLQSKEAQQLGIDYHRAFESSNFFRNLDVVVFSVSLIDFEQTVSSIPADALKGKLVVDTCVLNGHPKSVMLSLFGNFPEIDIYAESSSHGR